MVNASAGTPRRSSITPRRCATSARRPGSRTSAWLHGPVARAPGLAAQQARRRPRRRPGRRLRGLGGREPRPSAQAPRGRRVPAAAPGPLGRAFELIGDLRVGLDRRGRPMPGAPVGMLSPNNAAASALVDGPPLAERGPAAPPSAPADGGTGCRHLRCAPVQRSRLSRTPARRSRVPAPPEDDRRIAGLLGRRRQQQRLGRLRQATDPLDEQPLDAGADRQRVGKRSPPGELVGVQRRR